MLLRALYRTPRYTATLITVLALGLAANTSIFTAVNTLLLHPPGIPEPERLLVPRINYSKLHLDAVSLSPRDFGDLRQRLPHLFSATTAISFTEFNYAGPVRLRAAAVTSQFFEVFATRPRLGHTFGEEEDQPNRNRVVILSDRLWRSAFGSDPTIIGRRILLNAEPFEIIGVMPPEFQYPTAAELWVPLGLPPSQYTTGIRWDENLLVIARLAPGVSFENAEAGIHHLSDQILGGEFADIGPDGWRLFAVPFLSFNNASVRSLLLLLFGAVALVLLITCANVAGLVLARASQQAREYATRIALGATRWHILKHTLGESLVISIAASGLGIGLAIPAARMVLLKITNSAGRPLNLNSTVFAFTIGITALTVLLTGIGPGLQVYRFNAIRGSRQQLRGIIVSAEVALALVLLIATGLFFRSFTALHQVNPGYDARGLLTAQITLPPVRSATQRTAFFNEALERIRALPGVQDAAWIAALPHTGIAGAGSFSIKGHPPLPGHPLPHGIKRYVTPGFLGVLKIPLTQGRFFDAGDRQGAEPVCVIDEILARQYWPDHDPIGDEIDADGVKAKVVGVIARLRQGSLASEDIKGEYIFPMDQQPQLSSGLAIRAAGDPLVLATPVREVIKAIDPGQPLYSIRTMESRLDESLAPRRLAVELLGTFAVFALVLMALGVFGVIGYSVSQRTREFGLRAALGATSVDILGLVLSQGVRLALIGTTAGLIGAAILSRFIASMLFGVSPVDPLTFTVASAGLLAIVLAASYLPARRAILIDPGTALRHE